MTGGDVNYSFECAGNLNGWGLTVILGIHPSPEMLPIHPMELLEGRRIVGSVFGGFKGKTQLPHFAKKCIDGVVKLDDFITHELPFEEINKAFDLLKSGKSMRCLLHLNEMCPSQDVESSVIKSSGSRATLRLRIEQKAPPGRRQVQERHLQLPPSQEFQVRRQLHDVGGLQATEEGSKWRISLLDVDSFVVELIERMMMDRNFTIRQIKLLISGLQKTIHMEALLSKLYCGFPDWSAIAAKHYTMKH
ncbi:hypothetical protein Fmac_012203 [Flemingia macrophylla]|uniref:Alcohol dehydrogenase n=1 Tax=Flemingia macrophylla TaxID=520843 RepID=A0ABD1MQG8_9FABA